MLLLANAAADITKLAIDLPSPAIYAAALLVGLSFLVTIASGLVTIWYNTRPRPSYEELLRKHVADAGDKFATKDELNGAITTVRAEIDNMRTGNSREIRDLRQLVDQGFAEIRRSLGRVEGKLEK